MSNNIEAQKTAAATALQQQSMNDGTDLGKNIKLVRGRAISQLQQQSQQQQAQFQQQQQQGRKCARCGAAFGRFYNTGAPCPRCKHRVCRQCRELRSNNPNAANDWLCSVCHRIEDLRSVSAEWRRSTGRDNYLSALDILKYSIRRAWTINGPPARWSAARKSAEFRLYRSLPNRRRDYLDAENIKNAKKTPESFIKPPKIITKVAKPNESTTKKSSIPVFRNRSSKEFEDIRSPHESPKRSLIPQRYRGSTDDLRRSREDISIPSFIPKLLSPRNKEDKLKRQDSKDDIRSPSLGLTATAKFQPHQQQQQNLLEAKPTPSLRIFRRDNKKSSTEETNIDNSSIDTGSISSFICGEAPRQECSSTGQTEIGPNKGEPLKMVNELNLHATEEKIDENSKKIETHDETDDVKQSFMSDSSFVSNESKVYDKTEEGSQIADEANTMFIKETDKEKVSESVLNKKIDESQVVKRKFSKEELSNDDTDDAHNRRSSSHLSPEASPLSTRSSRYSPRESESEPTPALPRKTAIERGESSSASQRIRDAITRTRRESNSSAKYESSGSEGVRLGDSGISSYVDIARRVKLFGSGSIGPSTGSCDEILHRDSATSAGEDDHDDHSRDPTRMGPGSQNRVMLRRRRQFDAQGPRRRGRSHARSCCGAEELQALQVVGCAHSEEEAAAAAAAAGPTLLDYRRLVFISSDSSSGREEDDADSSCSGSSYLNQPPGSSSGGSASGSQQNAPGLEDCDWDYFESNSLKLPPLQALPPQQHNQQIPGRDWTCCTARPFQTNSPSGCCQACGGSRNAKVLPVPVPIPVPVPYPVPVPASLWTGEFGSLEGARAAAASSMISRDSARLEQSLPLNLRGCDPSAAAWFSWNPRFDTSSLLFSQNHIFQQPQLSSSAEILLQPEKQEEKVESDSNRDKSKDDKELENESKELPDLQAAIEENEEQKAQAQPQQQQQRMFRHLQEQDSRSSSGRSSADSSDLEDSASHRFSRVLIVNDDSLTSDNDIEDNEDSDSAREGHPVSLRRVGFLADQGQHKDTLHEEEPVVLRRIRQLDEDADLDEDKSDKSLQLEEENEQVNERKSKNKYTLNCDDNQQEIASYDEIYLASNQENSENLVLLKSIRSIDPEGTDESIYRTDKNFTPGYKAFPKQSEKKQEQSEEEELVLENLCESEKDDSSNDSAVMPDSLEVSMQDLEDSIEVAGSTTCDAERALLAASSPIEGKSVKQEEEGLEEEDEEREGKRNPSSSSPSSSESSTSAGAAGTLSSSDELHEYSLTPCASEKKQQQDVSNISDSAALMAKSRKKWQIPASFDIKGIPSTHFMPPERKKDTSHSSLNPLLSAAVEAADELQPEDEENANGCSPVRDDDEEDESLSLAGSMTIDENAHDESNDDDGGGGGGGGSGANSERVRGNSREFEPPTSFYEQVGGSAEDSRYRAVERRTPTRKEELFDEDDVVVSPSSKRRRDWVAADVNLSLNHLNNNNINNNNAAANQVNNKYRSLVMITQGAYQPVNVITSDTTTLLQPQLEQRGYFQLAQDANQETTRRSALQGLTKKPLPCKRLLTNPEPEVDSGLSVGSAGESDDVQSVKNASKQNSRSPILLSNREEDMALPLTPPQEYEQAKRSGPLILEEGLADDDSWVEEISHDEDEQSATTATEESSEDETGNNLGDREEELRGYHRQAIDFTLHTIVEESCEESESEHASASWRRRLVSASAPDLDKYLFFGLGPDGGGNSSREMDSLSETSSIFSEGLDSLAREESAQNSNQEKKNAEYSNGNSSRMEKYFLAEFLGLDQDRRDSDGSVGSDSEGRPSPEAQRRKRLVRPRGTGRSHSSSLDNLLALAHSSQNSGSYQNSLQDGSPGTDGQELQSEGSSTETDGADENPAPAFGTDGQFDTVKRRKKKLRNPGAQSPRVSEDRNKTPEPRDAVLASVELPEEEADIAANSEEDGAKTPQPEIILANSPAEGVQNVQDEVNSARSKQQSRDSGFVGSCDDLLLTPQRNAASEGKTSPDNSSASGDAAQTKDYQQRDKGRNDRLLSDDRNIHERILESQRFRERFAKIDVHKEQTTGGSLSRKDSFNNWSSDEETNLMMSKMRQFFKTMVANSNNTNQTGSTASSAASPVPSPSPRLSGYSSKTRNYTQTQNRTKPPQLVYFENELTRLMKTVPGIRDEQVREIVEYLSSEDTWSDSYDSSDYTSSDLEGATAGGRRSALQEQISQSCQQIISKFDTNAPVAQEERASSVERKDAPIKPNTQQALGRDTAFVYQKLVQSFTKMAGDNVTSDTSSTPHSSPPLIAKVMHHIGSRLVALMHEVSESNSTGGHSHTSDRWRRYPHHRTPSSASTTEDDDSTSDSASAPTHLPRSKSHDPLLLINGHASATSMPPEAEEREASDYERFSWRGSFESALMAADSRTKLSLLACSGDMSATAMAAKRRSAGDLLFNPKSFSREQLDRVRSCGSIGGTVGAGTATACGGSIEEKIWSNRRRSSVPDANTRGESGASAGDEDTEDEEDEDLDYATQGDSRATTLPRGMQVASNAATSATNSLPRQSGSSANMHKAHSVYHFLPQHSAVKSARYRPPGFTRNSPSSLQSGGPKRAFSAPGLQLQSRSRRAGQQSIAHGQNNTNASSANVSANASADEASLSEACSTPIIGASSRTSSSHTSIDLDDLDRSLHSTHLATRASLSSLGARSDSMASVYSGAGEGRWCGSVAVRGEVEFSLQYDYKQLTFEVHVTQCRDLAPVDVKRNRSDPYVKVYLLPDKSKSGKRKTKVKKHTLNPVFDETLKFHTNINSLESRTLWLTVWHSDMFGRNDFLGEVRMPLENKIFDDPRPQWYPLQERTEPFDDPVAYKGEVIVGLKFVPPDPSRQDRDRETNEQRTNKLKKNWSRGSLHVLVKEARNLQTRAKNSGTCDPFCKSYLLPDKGRSGKQKTGVVRRSTGSPVWNHTFVYKDVSLQELAERGLELTVWDHDRIASNEFLGGVRFNLGTGKHYGKAVDWMDATGREMSLWQSMLERPNFWVEGVVTLRPNLHNHGKTGPS